MKTFHTALSVILVLIAMTGQPAAVGAQDDCPQPLMFYTFNHEMKATVTAEAGINLRAEPSTGGALVGNVPDGADILLDENTPPVCADGYRWQHAQYAGLSGWVAEGRGGDDGYNLAPVVLRFRSAGRLSYHYDERLAGQIGTRTAPPDGDQPGYDEVQFNRYQPGVGITEMPRYLRLYRTAEFAEGSIYRQVIEEVRDLLYARVNHEAYEVTLPPLPPLEGSDPQHTQVAFMDFDHGSGVRTLVLHSGTDGQPTLAYQFVGLTTDGEYLVSLTVPLPGDVTEITQVESLPPQAFSPTLDLMDQVARSVSVNRPEGVAATDPTAATSAVAFGSIRFEMPSELARRVEFDLIAPNGDIARMSMVGPQPGRTEVTFVGYPDENGLRDPLINVIDAASAPEGATQFAGGVERLRALLDEQPALATSEAPADDPLAQAFVGGPEPLFIQPEYVSFEGGRGVRYLTLFTQNRVMNVEPSDLYYVFEGLTDDGRYRIHAILPVSGSYSIATEPYDPADVTGGIDGLNEREAVYVAALSRELDGLPPEAFTPGLDALDAMIESLRVG